MGFWLLLNEPAPDSDPCIGLRGEVNESVERQRKESEPAGQK